MLESPGGDPGQLDAFHDLVPTLARGLDVREIFRQLSDVAARIVPHDEATLLLQKADGHFEMFASTGTPREIVCCNDPAQALNTREPQLLDSIPEPDRGLQSGLTVPVRINDQFFGVFALFAQRPHAYADRDLAQAERLAAYLALAISHQRLADAARDAAHDRERAASIETSVELLRTISGVLDVRSVFRAFLKSRTRSSRTTPWRWCSTTGTGGSCTKRRRKVYPCSRRMPRMDRSPITSSSAT